MTRLRRTWPQRLLIGVNAAAVVLSLCTAWFLHASWVRASSVVRVRLGSSLTPAEESEPGDRVLNFLLVGSDSSAGLDPDDPINVGRVGERNGDVIIVAHLDERDATVTLLSLPRDLWVTIAGTSRSARINSAFAVGGPSTLIETIEQNFGIPINHYMNVDFAGFEGLVEAVGSVEIEFPTPARDWNPARGYSQTGFIVEEAGCHALGPETALAYVRSRYYQTMDEGGRWVSDPTSDLGRIRRQQDFIKRLADRAVSVGARNPFVLSDLIDVGLAHVSIDEELTPQLLVDLGRTYRDFEPEQIETYSFPSRSADVDAQSVLLPMPEEAAPILELFRGVPATDPGTVGLRIVHAAEQYGTAEEFSERLGGAGFDVDASSSSNLPEGIVLRHGTDGASAARLVADALVAEGLVRVEVAAGDAGAPIPVEEVSGLMGREVVIVIGARPVAAMPAEPDDSGTGAGDTDTGDLGAAGEEAITGYDRQAGEVAAEGGDERSSEDEEGLGGSDDDREARTQQGVPAADGAEFSCDY